MCDFYFFCWRIRGPEVHFPVSSISYPGSLPPSRRSLSFPSVPTPRDFPQELLFQLVLFRLVLRFFVRVVCVNVLLMSVKTTSYYFLQRGGETLLTFGSMYSFRDVRTNTEDSRLRAFPFFRNRVRFSSEVEGSPLDLALLLIFLSVARRWRRGQRNSVLD